MWRAIAVVLVMAACSEQVTRNIDGGIPPEQPDPDPGCVVPDGAGFDYFGETCTPNPDPEVNTLCHGEQGWCVAGSCRPTCTGCYRCPRGAVIRYLVPAGGCYCSPE